MKISTKPFTMAGAALAVAMTLSASPAFASTVLTTYSSGDVIIGFRQTGVASTVVANLGSITKFLPASLGGTWDGNAFNVQFGLIPNTATAVTNLSADLVANFGADWSDNLTDGSGVRWGVVGSTDGALADVPIAGYNNATAFFTKARTTPGTQSAVPGSVNNSGFSLQFTGFSQGIGGGSYINQQSTENSSVTYIGAGSDVNNWGTRIQANSGFGLGSNRVIDQGSGTFQGTTNSVLDFYVGPSAGSTLATTRTYTGGSFSLNSAGELTYGVVPEPGSAALLGFGVALLGMARRRKQPAPVLF